MLRAQFQEPTPEELKMTADPKAPGAAAVYLDREENDDGNNLVETYYARIKVLTEKGKELATVRIPFDADSTKVDKVDGRTIHTDGTIIPLSVKPELFTDYKSKYYQEKTLVFTLPNAEVGSILEYQIKLKYSDMVLTPFWELQSSYYIHKEHFVFTPPVNRTNILDYSGLNANHLMATIMPPRAPFSFQQDKRNFIVDLTDIAPFPDEDWMPPVNTIRWSVHFYYTYASNAQQYWDRERARWYEQTNAVIRETNTVKKAAVSLVTSGDTDEQKARKIYAALMKMENTDFSRVKSDKERKKEKLKDIDSLDDMWKAQTGPGNWFSLLYVALARAAGLKAYPMRVVDRNLAVFNFSYLNTRQLDDYIAIVHIGEDDIYLDPGQKMAPFGTLHWAHTLAGGFRGTDLSADVTQSPAASYTDHMMKRTADLTLDSEGKVSGTAEIQMSGAYALYWRQLALENSEDEVRKQFNEELREQLPEGAEAELDHFLQIDDPDSNLVAIVKIGGNMGSATGKRIFLPGLFFETRAKHPFVAQEKRITPIDVHFPMMETDQVLYHLPAGYTVENAPSGDISWPGYGRMRITSNSQENSLLVARVLVRSFTILNSNVYNELRDFYLKVAAADQQQIVLTRAAAGK